MKKDTKKDTGLTSKQKTVLIVVVVLFGFILPAGWAVWYFLIRDSDSGGSGGGGSSGSGGSGGGSGGSDSGGGTPSTSCTVEFPGTNCVPATDLEPSSPTLSAEDVNRIVENLGYVPNYIVGFSDVPAPLTAGVAPTYMFLQEDKVGTEFAATAQKIYDALESPERLLFVLVAEVPGSTPRNVLAALSLATEEIQGAQTVTQTQDDGASAVVYSKAAMVTKECAKCE